MRSKDLIALERDAEFGLTAGAVATSVGVLFGTLGVVLIFGDFGGEAPDVGLIFLVLGGGSLIGGVGGLAVGAVRKGNASDLRGKVRPLSPASPKGGRLTFSMPF